MNSIRIIGSALTATALAFSLTACGSDDAEEAATSSVTTKVTTSTTAPSTTTTTTTVVEPAEEETIEEAPASAPDPAAVASGDQVLADLGATPQQPVDGGAASPEDAQAIDALVRGANDEVGMRNFLTYMPRNACASLVEANGGIDAMTSMADLSPEQENILSQKRSTVTAVDDIRVNGDTASALVTSTDPDGTATTTTIRFLRENGRWTFCN